MAKHEEMTDLEWLARNEPVWREGYSHAAIHWEHGRSDKRKAMWVYSPHNIESVGHQNYSSRTYSKDQWKAERKRLGLDAPEWDGPEDGLPPIGQDVLSDTSEHRDVRFTVTGYHVEKDLGGNPRLHRVFVDLANWDNPSVKNCRMLCDLRPLKSQEQREREEAIDRAFSVLSEFREARQVLGDLYDAGWLKKPD